MVTALLVALVHSAVMMACGLALAWTVYRWLGLRFITRSWFNLEAVWGASVLTGVIAAAVAWAAPR